MLSSARTETTTTMTKPVDSGDAIRVVDKPQIKSSVSYDMEAARAAVVAPEVSFRIDGPAAKASRRIVVRGLLENAGRAAVSITIFSAHGAAGPFGLFVEPATSCATRKPRTGPPLPMQVPPPPLVLELPARTAVRVERYVELGEYDWIPNAAITVDWSYHFWNEPRPRGTVVVR
jgi:hypothetical protein